MATILSFPERVTRGASAHDPALDMDAGSAEIIIFSGVRIERLESSTASQIHPSSPEKSQYSAHQ